MEDPPNLDETLDVTSSSVIQLGFLAPEGGPRDLTQLLLEKRNALAGQEVGLWLFGDVNDVLLEKILRIAFEVSFRKDEGRYTEVTIFVSARRDRQSQDNASIQFDPPVPLDVRTLRRLSSAVPPRPHALFVKSVDGALFCTGMGRFETAGAHLPEDVTGLYSSSNGLMVEVKGPGDLTVHEAGDVFTLSAGRLHRQFDGNQALAHMPHFGWITEGLIETHLGEVTPHVRDRATHVVRDTWAYVLKETVNLAHGGAFAILPEEFAGTEELPPEWHDQIAVTYPTQELDLVASIGHYVQCRWGEARESRSAALRDLQDDARAIARLSATDGYVLLDAGLRLLGFGVKIGFEAPIPSKCVEVDDRLAPTGAYAGLARTGTRHRAAFRLCQAVPGAIVFVVSQDGDLRVFFSMEDGEVRVTAALEPLTQLFQGM